MQNIILDVSQSWVHPGYFAGGEETGKKSAYRVRFNAKVARV
jgi:hypothetical protein